MKTKKIGILMLVALLSLGALSTSGKADIYVNAKITGFISDFNYTPKEGGTITVYNIHGNSVTMNINPDSLSAETVAWITAAQRYGWPVECWYDSFLNLRLINIYPVLMPAYKLFQDQELIIIHTTH